MVIAVIKSLMKSPKEPVGNKFLGLMFLNTLMRTKDKEFLGLVSDHILDRLKKIAERPKNCEGLKEFTDPKTNLAKSREAQKFYQLLG